MPREYAHFRTDIVGDDDFRDLTPTGQHLYFSLTIDPTLTHCGVVDWRPKRIAYRSKGWTVDDINASALELVSGLFILVDEETEEALVRSHIKHDGLMKNPRQAVSMMDAYAAVASKTLRGVIVNEVIKLSKNQPELACWESKYSGAKLRDMMRREAIDPADLPVPEGLSNTLIYPKNESSIYPKPDRVYGSTPPIPTPTPTPSTYVDNYSSPILDDDGHEYPITTLDAVPDAEEQKTKLKKVESHRPDVEELCQHLRIRILENGNRAPKAITDAWRTQARLLLDSDNGPTLSQALAVVDWCQADDFWRPNILSMPTFRAKYAQLEAKTRESYRKQAAPAAPTVTKQQEQRNALDAILGTVADSAPMITTSPEPDLSLLELTA